MFPVAEKEVVPSVTVTVKGGVPPITAILRFVVTPGQIVALPDKTEAVIGGTTPPAFNACALDEDETVKHCPQIVPPVAP